jgi:vacuolar-type H+-ATPase subunit F/Vma7
MSVTNLQNKLEKKISNSNFENQVESSFLVEQLVNKEQAPTKRRQNKRLNSENIGFPLLVTLPSEKVDKSEYQPIDDGFEKDLRVDDS